MIYLLSQAGFLSGTVEYLLTPSEYATQTWVLVIGLPIALLFGRILDMWLNKE